MRQKLWPSGTFVDFENGLNSAVNRLRDALGDSANQPRFIETEPRHGYRFIAEVSRRSNPIRHSAPFDAALETPSNKPRSPFFDRSNTRIWKVLLPAAASPRSLLCRRTIGTPTMGLSVAASQLS